MVKQQTTSSIAALAPNHAEMAFREFWRVAGLWKRQSETHFARFGISPAQWAVLRTLHRLEQDHQQPPRVTELSSHLLLQPPSVSGVVERLVRLRLVTKVHSKTDMRARRVRLSQQGRELVQRILINHTHWIDTMMGGLTPSEQHRMSQLMIKLAEHQESTTALDSTQGQGAREHDDAID
jgi:DNA-binding MarR family transcriptional regulator